MKFSTNPFFYLNLLVEMNVDVWKYGAKGEQQTTYTTTFRMFPGKWLLWL